jgi:hypothetical protein
MANVFLVGVEPAMAAQTCGALAVERHRIEQKPEDVEVGDLIEADIVFAGCELSLLHVVRDDRPALPFVVFAHIPETNAWLDAVGAGATDDCSSPFEPGQINWLMASAMPKYETTAVGSRFDPLVTRPVDDLEGRRAAVIGLRFYSGLTLMETAASRGISSRLGRTGASIRLRTLFQAGQEKGAENERRNWDGQFARV